MRAEPWINRDRDFLGNIRHQVYCIFYMKKKKEIRTVIVDICIHFLLFGRRMEKGAILIKSMLIVKIFSDILKFSVYSGMAVLMEMKEEKLKIKKNHGEARIVFHFNGIYNFISIKKIIKFPDKKYSR